MRPKATELFFPTQPLASGSTWGTQETSGTCRHLGDPHAPPQLHIRIPLKQDTQQCPGPRLQETWRPFPRLWVCPYLEYLPGHLSRWRPAQSMTSSGDANYRDGR